MATDKDTPAPDSTSSEYDAQIAFWEQVDAILGGEAAIKAGTEKYLPKLPDEEQGPYDYRLASAPFTNIYDDIQANLASKPFAKDLTLKDGTPEQYLKLAENIDGQGNNLHVFARATFAAGMNKGVDFILVDFTKATPRADGKPLTRQEEKDQGLRPYWVHVPADRALAVYSEFVGGVEVIHHVRIRETSKQIDGFKESTVDRVRVLNRVRVVDAAGNTVKYEPATWELWEQRTGADGKSTWDRVAFGAITIGVIALVPFVPAERNGGSWIVKPPLRNLANMQISEYKQEANLEWVRIMTCFPMLAISGVNSKDEKGQQIQLRVGPSTVLFIPQNAQGTGPAGEATYVEPTTESIKETREQLELMRKEMRDLGMQPLTQAALTVVTTANVSKKASSAVQAWAFLFKDALELAWKYTAMWLNDTAEPEVQINTDFAVEVAGETRRDVVLKAQGQGVISKQTAREELKRDDTLSNNVDDDEEEKRLAKETESLEAEEDIDPITGKPIKPDPQKPPIRAVA